jgi:hypothetical protein
MYEPDAIMIDVGNPGQFVSGHAAIREGLNDLLSIKKDFELRLLKTLQRSIGRTSCVFDTSEKYHSVKLESMRKSDPATGGFNNASQPTPPAAAGRG